MTRGKLIRLDEFTWSYADDNPQLLFAFGDNMARKGRGGQAVIRGLSNAIGIPTKWLPTWDAHAFFCDADWGRYDVRESITLPFDHLDKAITEGRDVVIAAAGLGTGRARLPQKAPMIFRYIEARIANLATEWPE
jgi:hypothetical protein